MSRRKIALVCVALAAIPLANIVTACAASPRTERPAYLDRSLQRPTQKGAFTVRIESRDSPVPLHRIHRWSVTVADPQGHPVSGATIRVDGGMPEHGHGLPTAPSVQPATPPGSYVIIGMKFSMDGWWELKLDIEAGGVTDRVTFNLVL